MGQRDFPDVTPDSQTENLAAVDTEWALLGTCFQDAGCAAKAAALPSGCFTQTAAKAMHKAITELSAAGTIDALTVADAMRRQGIETPENAVMHAMSAGYLPSMFDEYAAILDRYRMRRTLSSLGWTMWQEARNDAASPDAVVAEALSKLSEGVKSGSQLYTTETSLLDFYDWLYRTDDHLTGTGLPDLDKIIGGFQPGQLIVLAARPKVGKSALAAFMAEQAAKHGKQVLFVSLEMGRIEIMQRRVAMESGVDLSVINRRQPSTEDSLAIAGAVGQLNQRRITYDEGAFTPYRVARSARELLPKGLDLIIIDYLQLMSSDTKTKGRTEEVSAITRSLKQLAMELDVPILALSQFNRQSEMGSYRRMPAISELRESGSIEQDANMVLILHEPEEPPEHQKDQWQHYHACQMAGTSYMWLNVAANRQGPTGLIELSFDKPHVRFTCFDKGGRA